MPIRGLQWEKNSFRDFDASRDRHVLRSQISESLLAEGNLRFLLDDGTEQSAESYLAAFDDVTIEFKPLFRAQRLAGSYSGFGIHVDAGTGSASFDAGPRNTNAPRNFLLQVSVLRNVGGKFSAAEIPAAVLRIHVHESVTQIWLTPEPMSIHQSEGEIGDGATLHRFTAVAEFDDGTVGDVTMHHSLTWSAPFGDPFQIDEDGFIGIFASDPSGTTIKIVAKTSAAWGSKNAHADVVVAKPWKTGTPITATLVGGPDAAWRTVPMQADFSANVLFLGVGFHDDDASAYETLIAGMCTRMKRDLITRPFDLLSDSMNYWRARVPTKTRGITVRCEVVVADDAVTLAKPLTEAVKPPAIERWEVSHLMYAVGRPMPSDVGRTAKDLRDEFVKRADADWALTLQDDTLVTNDVIRAWSLEGRRMFIDAIDGFPPLVVGSPPSIATDATIPFMECATGFRGVQFHLEDFLKNIVADNGATVSGGQPLGTLWAADGFAFDNRRLLVMFGATASGRSNTPQQVLLAMAQTDGWHVEPTLGRRALRLKVEAGQLPFGDVRSIWRTAAHELGHALHLGDEYPRTRGTLGEEGDPDGALFDFTPNVLSLSSVLRRGTPGSKISGELVKWRWPRIQRVAVIAAAVSEAGGTFTVPVLPRHAFQFTAGMKVRFRARTVGVPLTRFTPGTEVSAGEFVVSLPPSGAGDRVALQLVSGAEGQGTLGRFKPGSFLFEPVAPPAGTPPSEYPFAELLTFGVRNWLSAKGADDPLFFCDPDLEFLAAGDEIPAFEKFKATFSPRNNQRLVGLYKCGGDYACGTYHPTGVCMMRNEFFFDEFCAVCRYALVDLIDPTVHPDIEKDLGARNFE